MKRILWLLVPLALLLVFSVSPISADAAVAKVQINLTAGPNFPGVKGKARFEDRGGERRLRVEVEKALPLAGQNVDIRLNGGSIGTALVDPFGSARLALNTDLGDTVPIINPGDLIEVIAADSSLVAKGNF